MQLHMPDAPAGTRWLAEATEGDWIVLRLGPAEWDDEEMRTGTVSDGKNAWPAVLNGLSGGGTADVIRMAHSLVARYRERFPTTAKSADLVAAINDGKELPDVLYPTMVEAPRDNIAMPTFYIGEWVKIGSGGKARQVTVETDSRGWVGTRDMTKRNRRVYALQLVRLSGQEAKRLTRIASMRL